MNLKITKSARQFGYLIWSKNNTEMVKLLDPYETICVKFNGFDLGEKRIDRNYYRISLGFKLTRAMPASHDYYSIKIKDGILEVVSFNAKK